VGVEEVDVGEDKKSRTPWKSGSIELEFARTIETQLAPQKIFSL